MSSDDQPKPLSWDRLAAKLGMDSRALRRLKLRDDAPPLPEEAPWREFLARLDAERRGKVDADGLPGSCPYDVPVTDGKISYADAKRREEVNEQLLKNEALSLDLAERRKSLLTRDQARAFQADLGRIFKAALSALPEIVTRDLPAHEKPPARDKAERWVVEILTKIDSDISAWTGPKT